MQPVLNILAHHLPDSALSWLERTVRDAADTHAFDRDVFLIAFGSAARHVGTAPVPLTSDDARLLHLCAQDAEYGDSPHRRASRSDEIVRTALLQFAAERISAAEVEMLLEECFRLGDTREREAVLRTLPLLPRPERFLSIAIEACRSHVQPVFEAIACDNTYPASHFPDLNFNQMVLKAVFTGVALKRIVNLTARITPELARMAESYASERRAAGRNVPADINLIIPVAMSTQ